MFDAEARLELIGFVVVQNADTCQSHFLLLTSTPVSKASNTGNNGIQVDTPTLVLQPYFRLLPLRSNDAKNRGYQPGFP